jgi:protein-histidine pros-kinase
VLINDLLDLAKIDAGKVELSMEPTSCASVLAEAAATLRPLAERKGLQLEVAVVPAELVVQADRRALSQIVLNLAGNAIKFTERGRVLLAASACIVEGRAMVEIDVRDTGIGIREEDKAGLFEPFAQVDAGAGGGREGTGLGLHLSRKLAELLGGSVTLRSEYGKGTTFTLRLAEA